MSVYELAKKLLDEALKLQKDYIATLAKLGNVQKEVDKIERKQANFFRRIEDKQSKFFDKMQTEHDEIKLRVMKLEAIVESTFANSLKEAIVQVAREHIERDGSLESLELDRFTGKLPSGVDTLDSGDK